MQMTFRWFGSEKDTVTLEQIKQIPNVVGVVPALHNLPAGEAWELDDIMKMKSEIEKAGLTMAIALILSLIFCNGIMKHLWARPRAFWVVGQNFVVGNEFENLYGIFNSIHDYSFPSGHSSASFAAAVSIFMWRKKEGSAALVLAALIAFSRLYFTVHYPTDVLVGTITGALYGVAAYFIVKALMNKVPKLNAIFNKQ